MEYIAIMGYIYSSKIHIFIKISRKMSKRFMYSSEMLQLNASIT